MKIAVVGIGYVGCALSLALAKNNEVVALDINIDKINYINEEEYDRIANFYGLSSDNLNIKATNNEKEAYENAKYIFVCVPTNYDETKGTFNVSIVESVVESIAKINPFAVIVIKSTIPLGFTKKLGKKHKDLIIMFSPEFLRETKCLYDVLNPSRVVVGINSKKDKQIANELINILKKSSVNDAKSLIVDSQEAEAIKLFSNTYLAMRVAFFNELDTFAETHNLSTKNIIDGVCLDSRIGNFYNNPSFGYGGYCLPKDTKQLKNNFENVPEKLITATIESNDIRISHIAKSIENKVNKSDMIGVFRLVMKKGSDNFRSSSILKVIKILVEDGYKVEIYEPIINSNALEGVAINNDLTDFFNKSKIIVTNRYSQELEPVKEKVYTRDLFNYE